MRFRSVSTFSILCSLALIFSACSDITASQIPRVELAEGASSANFLRIVGSDARKIGARSKRYGDQAAVVTYRGAAQDFIACRRSGSDTDISKSMLLDSRTKVVMNGRKVTVDTLYIATAKVTTTGGKDAASSVAFSSNKVGQFGGGVTCRATGKLEQKLLGQG